MTESVQERLRRSADYHRPDDFFALPAKPESGAQTMSELVTEAANRIEALEKLVSAFAANILQREYPCSPHCAGYLREQALLAGCLSRAASTEDSAQ